MYHHMILLSQNRHIYIIHRSTNNMNIRSITQKNETSKDTEPMSTHQEIAAIKGIMDCTDDADIETWDETIGHFFASTEQATKLMELPSFNLKATNTTPASINRFLTLNPEGAEIIFKVICTENEFGDIDNIDLTISHVGIYGDDVTEKTISSFFSCFWTVIPDIDINLFGDGERKIQLTVW